MEVYQALYRKWRPKVFEDVAGQPHITNTLKNELENGRLAHAYIFTGPRGTGKTTCAKILAKAANCQNLRNGDPCNECESCRGIDSGSVLDVVEIDAASNNGVDNIRDLREETAFTPVSSKYRVYIIDEAHMLSAGAFNALLKTLEEPPAYVIFILATTEAHKIPATILSRCQRFNFKRIPTADIVARLSAIAQGEQIKAEPAALSLIARLSDGGLRDAVSLLDQCAGGAVTEAAVSEAAGVADKTCVADIAAALAARDAAAVLRLVGGLYDSSKDLSRLCEELIWHFRDLMVAKTLGDGAAEFLSLSPEDAEKLLKNSQDFTPEAALHIMDGLRETAERMRRSPSRRAELEMGLLKICRPETDASLPAILRRLSDMEAKLRTGGIPVVPAGRIVPSTDEKTRAADAPAPSAMPAGPETPAQTEPPGETGPDEPFAEWPEVLSELAATDPPLRGVLDGSSAILRGGHILVDVNSSMFPTLIRQQTHKKALVEAIRKISGQPYKVGVFKKSLAEKREDDGLGELMQNLSRGGVEYKLD